ncbi:MULTISPECIES: TraR/DksA C4-type zinc finger protein [Alteromonas]|jgi:DnaK suppressor protein|uniref:TraR/DksA C4-type zinc finger protein n=1 Tax=Alteromonas stellipolaris TaxID=233316 RepID=A0AAW7Z079_9ALTE|nr:MULTISPECIES: TraR/DksA C4-type zinc finger protein [Alteromonas]AMJ92327.1 molecular chaperone DnaK [Alteromonas sp. Mac2]AMJ88473.1 molecular chaperone DnaK [Alteromonas sp. Mac1]AMJ96165.1 molecular chaperone DnaK [Alteromonas stellipolaris]ANB20809.1 molecular chaperone DnaK [Alteromonas stellipolaris]ANB25312.1 molecular chaperone DnaK [Alteromonas stellipolaris]
MNQILDKQQLLDAPAEDYMNDAQLEFFKALLTELKKKTMLHIEEMKVQLSDPPEINDDVDRAQYEEDSRIGLRILDRERKLILKIDKSLRRITEGDFGYCQETGEPIGIPRLLIRPISEYCADVKQINEGKERHFQRERK